MKSCIVQIKLCKENHRVRSKTFSIFVLRLNYVVLLQDIVHLHIAIRSHIF